MYFDVDPSQELKDILVESLQMNPCNGSSTVVMAKLEEINHELPSNNQDKSSKTFINKYYLKTINLGDSGYLILRPNSET